MEYLYLIFDHLNHCIGFTDSLEDAIFMANQYKGHYELEEQSSIFE